MVGVDFDAAAGTVVVAVKPYRSERSRCGLCRRRSGRYDSGEGIRRWRALDLGSVRAYLEAQAPRVRCRDHGVVVAAVPWARHNAGHTRDFDDAVAWLATACSKSAVTELMRIAWRTVGAIIARVCTDIDARVDRLAGLRRVGIDEISYRKGQKFLTIVVDHDTGRLVWARPGRDAATLAVFFDELGPQRSGLLTHVSADTASWIATTVAIRAPQAIVSADPFHIVAWATQCLDDVRRQVWNHARRRPGGMIGAGSLDVARAADALWSIGSPESYLQLTHDRRLDGRGVRPSHSFRHRRGLGRRTSTVTDPGSAVPDQPGFVTVGD